MTIYGYSRKEELLLTNVSSLTIVWSGINNIDE